jgi:hypothetical protein
MTLEDARTGNGGSAAWGLRHLSSGFGLLFLLIWLPFYAFVSLVAPSWAVVPSLLVWLGFLVLVIRWFRPHPVRAFLAGAGAIVLWHVAGLLLDALGWAV